MIEFIPVVLDGVYLDVKDLEGFEKECLEVMMIIACDF